MLTGTQGLATQLLSNTTFFLCFHNVQRIAEVPIVIRSLSLLLNFLIQIQNKCRILSKMSCMPNWHFMTIHNSTGWAICIATGAMAPQPMDFLWRNSFLGGKNWEKYSFWSLQKIIFHRLPLNHSSLAPPLHNILAMEQWKKRWLISSSLPQKEHLLSPVHPLLIKLSLVSILTLKVSHIKTLTLGGI